MRKGLMKLCYLSCMILGFAIFFSGCNATEEPEPLEFMSINGTDISQEEYALYIYETIRSFEEIGGSDIWDTDFDGRSAIDVAKDGALNSMISVKVSVEEAHQMGITLSESQKKQAADDALKQIAFYNDAGVETSPSFQEAVYVTMEDGMLYSMIREEVVKDYAINETDFGDYSASYFDETTAQMKQMTIKVIVCESEDIASEVYEKVMEHEDFDQLFNEYNILDDVEETLFTTYQKDAELDFGQIVECQEGYVTKPIEYEDETWRIMKVLEIKESTPEAIKEKLRLDYTNTMRQQIFSAELEKWIDSAIVEINNEKMEQFLLDFQK